VSFYTSNEYGSSSKIEFGGWDKNAVMEGETMDVIDAPKDAKMDL